MAIGAGIAALAGIGAGIESESLPARQLRRWQDSRRLTERSQSFCLLGGALAEATAIYGFVVAILIISACENKRLGGTLC